MFHTPRNIFDDSPAIRVLLQKMPQGMGMRILESYGNQTAELEGILSNPPSPHMVRTSIGAMKEIGALVELASKLGTIEPRYIQEDIVRQSKTSGGVSLEDAAQLERAREREDGFTRNLEPVQGAMADLCAEIEEFAGYVEFLHIKLRKGFNISRPGEMMGETSNPRLLDFYTLDRYEVERCHPDQDDSKRVGSALAVSDSLRQELSALATRLGGQSRLDVGQAFVYSKLIPRILQDLEYFDHSLLALDHEMEDLQKASPIRRTGFSKVESVQAAAAKPVASALDERIAQAAAVAAAAGDSKVSSIFGGPRQR